MHLARETAVAHMPSQAASVHIAQPQQLERLVEEGHGMIKHVLLIRWLIWNLEVLGVLHSTANMYRLPWGQH
jgi:archaellum component FlaD/FlaE